MLFKKSVMPLSLLLLLTLTGCSSTDSDVEEKEGIDVNDLYESDSTPSTYIAPKSETPYTEDELKSDPSAPSTNVNDYDANGQYVPENGPSDDASDYSFDGEYKPVDEMSQDEIKAELESMFGN